MGYFQINWALFPPKAHYLLYFGGVAAFWPFVNVFGKQLGFSEIQVGYIFTVAPIAGIISMPLFGSIADRFKIKKKLFLVFNVINLLSILCFASLSTVDRKSALPVTIVCGQGTSYLKYCDTDNNWNYTTTRIKDLKENPHPVLCHIDCKVDASEVQGFCTALLSGSHEQPDTCSKNVSAGGLTSVTYQASLDFSKLTSIEQCIYFVKIVKFSEVLKNGEHQPYHGMSCYPETKLSRCELRCPDLTSGKEVEDSGRFKTLFSLYAFFILVTWIAMAVVTSVADALCFQTLGERHDLYGQQRKWGSVGWGLFTFISGFLVDLVSGDSDVKDYTPCFWIAAVVLALNLVVCWKWDVQEEAKPKAMGRRIIALISEPKITVFILACVVVGICTGMLWNYLFWYIEVLAKERMDMTMESVKWIKSLQGLISIVQCFGGELPFFYLAGRFLSKFGHVNSMAIVIGTFGVRFILYSYLINPWWVLPIELLQGFTYGIFYTNMATYAYVVSPDGTAATVQGIVGSAFEGVGVSCGSLIGGVLFKYLSGRTAFRLFGIFALLMSVLYKGIMITVDRRFQTVSQQQENEFGTEIK